MYFVNEDNVLIIVFHIRCVFCTFLIGIFISESEMNVLRFQYQLGEMRNAQSFLISDEIF